ncbi:transcriptional repressor LexA [Pullulanibacillus sp. KACC 23026]|uniref:transcriptional repressor LexA n=1 Tax=Pullulanibacillus sp. KACC 23026 TaxID=3028315 RepID=UPI0023B09CAB|nr:transcriptional repressor LexA [Pullulanibacillus sp. KACC 23026]WEG11533.1 transcriptional repressor LexA [Pullulanibacillus sp. KACC 23026]
MELSKRQQAIVDFIRSEVDKKGYPPSVREIGDAVGLASSSTVHGHLSRLEKKGIIRRDPTKPRAIELIQPGQDLPRTQGEDSLMLPIVGRVTAGEPITAIENVEDYYPVPVNMVGHEEAFILNVVGESMINAGILDGDKVVVRQQNTANNGDIIVAMTEEDEATVKRFFKEKDHIRLQPENPFMAPILVPTCTILGKVVGVIREIH